MLSKVPEVFVNGSSEGDIRSNYSVFLLPEYNSSEVVVERTDFFGNWLPTSGQEDADFMTKDVSEKAEPTLNPFHFFDPSWNYSWEFNWTFGNISLPLEDGADIPQQEHTAIVLKGIVLGLLVLMTITGNLLVLLAVFANSHLRGTTHYFIANLAVADLLLGTTVLPFSASLEIINYWAFGQLFCDIWAAVDVLCCTASIMSLCVISIDRYIGVTRPLQHSTIMSEKRAALIILSVWLLSIAISVGPLAGWGEPPPEDPTVCEVTKQLGYVLFSVSCSFYVPLTIILVVYFRVYREALSQSKFLATGMKTSKNSDSNHEVTLRIHTGRPLTAATKPNPYHSSSSSEHSHESSRKHHSRMTLAGKIAKFKREKKAAKTLGLVVGMFILCWLPFFFVLPLEALCSACVIPEWLFKIIFWLGYFNSMMNPVIYACSSREFRRAFLRIIRCQWRRRPRQFLYQPPSSQATVENRNGLKMGKLARLRSTLKKIAKGNRDFSNNRNTPNRRAVSSPSFFCRQSPNHRIRSLGESPICSLRQLHRKNRKDKTEVVSVSDDESAVHELSEDEKSEADNEVQALVTHKGQDCVQQPESEDSDESDLDNTGLPHDRGTTSLGKLERKQSKPTKAIIHTQVPDIIISEVCNDAMVRDGYPSISKLPKSTVGVGAQTRTKSPNSRPLYQFDEDNIMWL